jgi:hypothetical protein
MNWRISLLRAKELPEVRQVRGMDQGAEVDSAYLAETDDSDQRPDCAFCPAPGLSSGPIL